MVQGLSIEFLDFAATLWTDFRMTRLWFPLAKAVHPIPGLRLDLRLEGGVLPDTRK